MGSGDTVCKEAYKDFKFPQSQEAQHDAKVDQCEEALTGAHIPQCENPQGGALDMTTNWTDTTSQCQDYNISDDGLPCLHDGICSCGGFSQRNPFSLKGILREMVIADVQALKKQRVS